MVSDLETCVRSRPGYPRVVLFSQAPVEATRDFLATRWPTACAIADRSLYFYNAFGRKQARLGQILSLGVLTAAWRALRGGHRIGRVIGNTKTLPGILVVRGDLILWDHPFEHIGDHPRIADVPQLAGVGQPARGSSTQDR